MSHLAILAVISSVLITGAQAQQRCYRYADGSVRCNRGWFSGGRIAGVAIGAALLALLVLMLILLPCIKRRRAKRFAAASSSYPVETQSGYQQPAYYPQPQQSYPAPQQSYAPPQQPYPSQDASYNREYAQAQENQQQQQYAAPANPPPTYKGNGAV